MIEFAWARCQCGDWLRRRQRSPMDNAAAMGALHAQWRETCAALGLAESPSLGALREQLIAAYSEAHRHYHSTQHLLECFAQWRPLRALAERPGEVELALWFHDAVYALRAHDNEARSADWAHASALRMGIGDMSASRIRALVMATVHSAEPIDHDAQLLVDVDLSILGAMPARFDQYETQIRMEYAWVADADFLIGRARVLEGFLARPRIFSTDAMYRRLEVAARTNLERSIARLRSIAG